MSRYSNESIVRNKTCQLTNCNNLTHFEINFEKFKKFMKESLWPIVLETTRNMGFLDTSSHINKLYNSLYEYVIVTTLSYVNQIPSLCEEHFEKTGSKICWNFIEFISIILLDSTDLIIKTMSEIIHQNNQTMGFFKWIGIYIDNKIIKFRHQIKKIISNPKQFFQNCVDSISIESIIKLIPALGLSIASAQPLYILIPLIGASINHIPEAFKLFVKELKREKLSRFKRLKNLNERELIKYFSQMIERLVCNPINYKIISKLALQGDDILIKQEMDEN